MKKRIRNATIIIIILAIIVTSIYFIFQQQHKKDRTYEIEKITDYKYFVSKIDEEQKYGVIDTQGNILVPEEYDNVDIPNPSKPVFVCHSEDKTSIFNEKGERIYTEYEDVEVLQLKNIISDLLYEKSVMKYKKDGKYGIIDLEGKEITKPIYEEIDTLQYKEGELIVKKDGKYGIISLKGYELVEALYDQISADTFFEENERYYYDGYIVANKTDNGYRYGYVSYEGEQKLEPIYNDMQRIQDAGDKDNAYLLVAEKGRYGIFKNEKELIKTEYQSINFDNENEIFVVQQGKKYGVIDKEGKQIIDCNFEQIDVKGNYIYAQNEESTEVYDEKGNLTNMSADTTIVTIPEKKEYTIRIQTLDGKTIYEVCKNEQAVTKEYKYISYLEDDLFIASKEGEALGIIDVEDNAKTEFKYESIQVIPNTKLIQMSTDDMLEIVDDKVQNITNLENGKIVEKDEYIILSNETIKKYLTLDGKVVTNKEIFPENKLFATEKDGKWGFEDKSGNIIVEANYDKVTEFNKYGFAGVLKAEKWGIIKQDGKILLEPEQSNITSEQEPEFIGEYHKMQFSSGKIYYTK